MNWLILFLLATAKFSTLTEKPYDVFHNEFIQFLHEVCLIRQVVEEKQEEQYQ